MTACRTLFVALSQHWIVLSSGRKVRNCSFWPNITTFSMYIKYTILVRMRLSSSHTGHWATAIAKSHMNCKEYVVLYTTKACIPAVSCLQIACKTSRHRKLCWVLLWLDDPRSAATRCNSSEHSTPFQFVCLHHTNGHVHQADHNSTLQSVSNTLVIELQVRPRSKFSALLICKATAAVVGPLFKWLSTVFKYNFEKRRVYILGY